MQIPHYLLCYITVLASSANLFGQKIPIDSLGLIPNTLNSSPDYYCTWQTQQYYTNDGGSGAQRANMVEAKHYNSIK